MKTLDVTEAKGYSTVNSQIHVNEKIKMVARKAVSNGYRVTVMPPRTVGFTVPGKPDAVEDILDFATKLGLRVKSNDVEGFATDVAITAPHDTD